MSNNLKVSSDRPVKVLLSQSQWVTCVASVQCAGIGTVYLGCLPSGHVQNMSYRHACYRLLTCECWLLLDGLRSTVYREKSKGGERIS